MRENIEKHSYKAEILFAEDDINVQIGQMVNLIVLDVEVIIAAPLMSTPYLDQLHGRWKAAFM